MLPIPAADDKTQPSADPCKTQADKKEEPRATTELIRFPDKIVAGADPQEFFLRATNSSKDRMKSICLHADTISWVSDAASTESTGSVTMEWQDSKGTWQPITNKRDDSIYFGYVEDLPPDEYVDAKLRLKVDGKAKAGRANTYHSGIFVGKDDVCGTTKAQGSEKVKDRKTLEILPAGTQPGKIDHSNSPSPSPSQSNGSKSSASPSPSSSVKASSSASPSSSASASASASASTGTAGTTTTGGGTTTSGSGGSSSAQGSLSNTSVDGQLAKTGSSSSTPVIAGLAGAAVVAGGAAVAVARRRKNNA
ncbi:LAETG motif-containing sortase-dependent surface protein [Streptomyces albireticuli]|uniref:LAETG motif-containing sortase-dependent surface protein n=1 Tax=Streptomyces albireticuli TaxID=1940 RepID=UPI003686D1C2